METKSYVIYARVSTKEQEKYGHSLAGQVKLCQDEIARIGGVVVAIHSEVASGNNKRRRVLDMAIDDCEKHCATLVFSELDRLGRNEFQLFAIKENLDIYCVDNPTMSNYEFAQKAISAAEELRKIRARTKLGVARAINEGKTVGRKKGLPQNSEKAITESLLTRRYRSMKHNADIAKQVAIYLRDELSLNEIARRLNEVGFKTVRGSVFTPTAVKNLIKQFNLKKEGN